MIKKIAKKRLNRWCEGKFIGYTSKSQFPNPNVKKERLSETPKLGRG